MMAEHDGRIVVGVDTHKHLHVAVALNARGQRLGQLSVSAERGGYEQLIAWARSLGEPVCFSVEGAGSYGQGLVRALRRHDLPVLEAGRPDRRDRRQRGKSDPLDAENAARGLLAGTTTAVPKTATGTSEMIRELKLARDTAVKARTQAIVSLKALIVTVPDELRTELQPLAKAALRERCAALRPGPITTPLAAGKHALRALARRWQTLDAEIASHDTLLDELTARAAPQLRAAFGIGPDIAAEMLILAGDNPERIRSEAAFAKLTGSCPIPASSRHHPTTQAQRRRPPPSQQRPLPLHHRPHALPPTHDRLRRPPQRRGQDQARDHPLPQTLPRPRDLPRPHTPPAHAPSHTHHLIRGRGTRPHSRPTQPPHEPPLTTIGASTRSPRASSTASRPS
jgi:transposase